MLKEEKEISIEYIDAEKVWPNVSENLLNTCLDQLKIPHTWIAGTYLFPDQTLENRIKHHLLGASWFHHNLPINNIVTIHLTGDLHIYIQVINISLQCIIHDIGHSLKMKAFL